MAKKLLMGNEAIAHAALEAGVGVVAGYPGTPSSEIIETIARQRARGAAHGVYVEWSTNEKAALEMLFGASLAGARCLFTCKQMGLNVASDALMSLNYVSVRGGLVLIVADDPGPISSQTEQDTRRFAAFAKVPVLDPASPEQAFDMVKAAFELSERFNSPVIVRPTTRIDHASAFFDVKEETQALSILDDGFQHDPSRWVIFPRRAYEAHGEINERLKLIAETFSNEMPYSSFNYREQAGESFTGRATFGILAGGITASYVREALRLIEEKAKQAGIGMPAYRFMQLGTPYPFPEQTLAAFATGLADVLVLEELDSVIEDELAAFAGRMRISINIHGKRSGEARDRGENDVDDILLRIEKFLGLTGRLSLHRFRGNRDFELQPPQLSGRALDALPERPPVLCAGCPHRGAFYAVKQALDGKEAVMCGDIGCYTLGNAYPLEAVDTCLCMGAGITMAQGIARVNPEKKAVAYIGDSTFFASGAAGLSNASYNNHDITVMVLDNSTTAMTGGQPHPGTGITLMGTRSTPLSIEDLLRANGFAHIEKTNAFNRDASVDAVRRAFDFTGPSAVIFEGACIQLTKAQPPVIINKDICTGCKRCITGIGCPAISFSAQAKGPRSRDRGQAVIDTSLCVGCGLCTQVCPFHAIHLDSLIFHTAPAFVTPQQQTLKQALADQEQAADEALRNELGRITEGVVEARSNNKIAKGAHTQGTMGSKVKQDAGQATIAEVELHEKIDLGDVKHQDFTLNQQAPCIKSRYANFGKAQPRQDRPQQEAVVQQRRQSQPRDGQVLQDAMQEDGAQQEYAQQECEQQEYAQRSAYAQREHVQQKRVQQELHLTQEPLHQDDPKKEASQAAYSAQGQRQPEALETLQGAESMKASSSEAVRESKQGGIDAFDDKAPNLFDIFDVFDQDGGQDA